MKLGLENLVPDIDYNFWISFEKRHCNDSTFFAPFCMDASKGPIL
jgi:hypothetical protein